MANKYAKLLKSVSLTPERVYRAYLRKKFGSVPLTSPIVPTHPNAVLQTRDEWQRADAQARQLHLPLHRDPAKNWDHVEAAAIVLANTDPSAPVLDAGAELYGNVLPILYLYGYRQLYGINLDFKFQMRRGPIRYLPGDITKTEFASNHFGAATCLSVIEHGVPIRPYFQEMHRILRPGGVLVTSTDYFPTPISTEGKMAHGAPIKIFTREELEAVLQTASEVGFQITGELNLDCHEKPIRWAEYDLEYTFVMFTLRKP